MTRILCTGALGFIGKELCQRLEERGYEVYRLDRMVHSRYRPHDSRMVYCDVSNLDSCKRAVREVEPDILVHLAAIASTDEIMYNEPERMIDVTFKGTMNISLAFTKGKQFIFASSSEIYGQQPTHPFTEDMEPHPNNIYAVSKWASEKHLHYWSKETNIPLTIMRNFNTYGNLGYQRTLIDRCTKEMLDEKPTVRLGNQTAVRDWEFVDDHVNSYLTVIGNSKAYGETFNFCRGEPYTIRETVDRIMDATDYTGIVEWGTGHPRPSDVPLLHGDPSKAKRVLGWEAKYSLPQGLEEYVTRLNPK